MAEVCKPRSSRLTGAKWGLAGLLGTALVLSVQPGHSLPWNTDMYGQSGLAAGTAPQAPPLQVGKECLSQGCHGEQV